MSRPVFVDTTLALVGEAWPPSAVAELAAALEPVGFRWCEGPPTPAAGRTPIRPVVQGAAPPAAAVRVVGGEEDVRAAARVVRLVVGTVPWSPPEETVDRTRRLAAAGAGGVAVEAQGAAVRPAAVGELVARLREATDRPVELHFAGPPEPVGAALWEGVRVGAAAVAVALGPLAALAGRPAAGAAAELFDGAGLERGALRAAEARAAALLARYGPPAAPPEGVREEDLRLGLAGLTAALLAEDRRRRVRPGANHWKVLGRAVAMRGRPFLRR